MTLLTSNSAVASACQRFSGRAQIFVDTEFVRMRTYYPKLCLVQIADADGAVAIDALAPGVDLAPVTALMANPSVLKVFHACRQDMEIFVHLSGELPAPIFDTQIAAMVCGYGDSVSYDKLVRDFTGSGIDKTSQLTDWGHRPLSPKQIRYALSDVIHLRPIYEQLSGQLRTNGRETWVDEEMALVTDPDTYAFDPEEAWRRIKVRSGGRRFLALVRALAAYREREAQRRDQPRNWVLRDDVLLDIASRAPRTAADLSTVRTLTPEFAAGRGGRALLDVVARAGALPENDLPAAPDNNQPPAPRAIVELLRVLLKHKAEEHSVAQKLIASASDLEALARDDDAAVPALQGWRRDLFGADALAVKHGRLALAGNGGRISLIRL